MAERAKTNADSGGMQSLTVIQCGCGLQDADAGGTERKAVAVDPDA